MKTKLKFIGYAALLYLAGIGCFGVVENAGSSWLGVLTFPWGVVLFVVATLSVIRAFMK